MHTYTNSGSNPETNMNLVHTLYSSCCQFRQPRIECEKNWSRHRGQKLNSTMCACACTVRHSHHTLWRTHIFEFSSVCRLSIQSLWLAGWRPATQFNLRLLFYISICCNILVYALCGWGRDRDWWETYVFYLCMAFHSCMSSMCTVLVRFVRSSICLLVWLIK